MSAAFSNIVEQELAKARSKHPGGMNSPHEAYAVIQEEVEEFWELVKKDGDKTLMFHELKQIAAMCHRAVEDLGMI